VRNPALYAALKGNQPPPWWIRGILILTCTGVSFAHGSNDGQKGMGLIMLILIGTVPTAYALNHTPAPNHVEGIVTSPGKLRFLWLAGSQQDEENQLQRLPVPTSDHSAGDLALPPVHLELARRRRLAGGARPYRLLRVHSAVDKPFRADDRSGLA
jgi:phosphate/sulfate permease